MAATKDVLEHHTRALREGDLNAVLADYASDAVFFSKDGAFEGVDAIRPVFAAILSEFSKPGTKVDRTQQLINGDYAYILWTAETADNVYEIIKPFNLFLSCALYLQSQNPEEVVF